MKIVENWYKAWSSWLLMLAIAVCETAAYIPEVKEYLPAEWYRWVFIVIMVARVVRQQSMVKP